MNKDLIHCFESLSDSFGQISKSLREIALIFDHDDDEGDYYDGDDLDYDDIEDDIVNPAKTKGWQSYDKATNAICQGTDYKAIMLTDGYIFDQNDSTERVLEYVNKDIDSTPVEFVNDGNGNIGVKSIVFKNITGIACSVVILNEVALIAFYELPEPTTFDGVDFSIVSRI